MEVLYFTPGQPDPPGLPLARYRPTALEGALTPYLEAYTRPGDLVIDLFCTGPTWLREAAQAGRRALGLNVNRALLLAASLGVTAVERRAVEAAFTRLADARKGPHRLQAHVEGLYRTTCAACAAPVVADAFIWEREAPVAKRYRCAACGDGTPVERPADKADREAAARFEARGLSYWLLLDRAAPGDAPQRDRVAPLLDLYTPRNLSAVSDLLLKSDGLELEPPVRQVLDALLLEVLDRATGLRAPDDLAARPRRLKRPARYVEANVWQLFERALHAWRETPSSLSLSSLSTSPLSTRQAARDLPAGCARLIVVDPPRPDRALWHLTALWSYWLWGESAGAPLLPFLDRRRMGWGWLWGGLRGALLAVAPLLGPEGRLACLVDDPDARLLEALTLALAGAGYALVGWGAQPPRVHLAYRFDQAPGATAAEPDPLSRAVAERVAQASLDTLRRRGEPVAWPMLHAALYADLAQSGLLARAARLPEEVAPLPFLTDAIRSALEGAPLYQLTNHLTNQPTPNPPLWWLDPTLAPDAAPPLSDRVELAVAEILRDLLAVTEVELGRRVCARFPGAETPDGRLVRLCLFSYGDEHAPGHWRLRVEDDLAQRVAETDAVIAGLADLGRRLGFDVALGALSAGQWTVRWLDGTGHAAYVLAVRTTAVLGDLLFDPPPLEPESTPCLTLPGGRAVLVGHKLRHDPRLRRAVKGANWQFLKFRHLRHLVQEVAARQLDRYAFRAALGLDPIVEQEAAQLSLW